MSEPVIYPSASVGAGATLDPNVYVGYPTGRHIAERTLTVGDGATAGGEGTGRLSSSSPSRALTTPSQTATSHRAPIWR